MEENRNEQATVESMEATEAVEEVDVEVEDSEVPLDKNVKLMSPTRMVLRRFFKSKLSIVGLVMVIGLFVFCFAGPLVYKEWGEIELDESGKTEYASAEITYTVNGKEYTVRQTTEKYLKDNFLAAPSSEHILGTDNLMLNSPNMLRELEFTLKIMSVKYKSYLNPCKLLQMANGAIYNEEKSVFHIHNRKLDALEDLIEGANGKPVLVAYWYKHDLDRIKKSFKVREIKTSKDINDWNNGKIPIAIIHPASAGHGLNLQSGGSTLIWFGLTWSLELYQQTNARLWRQGQKSTVVIHHIISKDTIDEDVMKALRLKEKTQTALINAVKARIGGGNYDS